MNCEKLANDFAAAEKVMASEIESLHAQNTKLQTDLESESGRSKEIAAELEQLSDHNSSLKTGAVAYFETAEEVKLTLEQQCAATVFPHPGLPKYRYLQCSRPCSGGVARPQSYGVAISSFMINDKFSIPPVGHFKNLLPGFGALTLNKSCLIIIGL